MLEDILQDARIPFQIVECRAKTVESFAQKILRRGKSYKHPLTEIHDLCGCRIIAYYDDDCERIAEIIRAEFRISEEELSHTQQSLEDDRFGYISRHYVVDIGDARSKIGEWKRYKNIKAEIQIRTVIQHAWSAVSHALQYKAETSVPSHLRRRLFRIAGLFELADEQFIAIRDERVKLRSEVSQKLERGEKEIPLTVESIDEFVSNWIKENKVAERAEDAGFIVEEMNGNRQRFIETIYNIGRLNNISDIKELSDLISKSKNDVFSRLIKGQPNGKEDLWHISGEFGFMLALMDSSADSLSIEFLEENGWDKSVAEHTLRSLKD